MISIRISHDGGVMTAWYCLCQCIGFISFAIYETPFNSWMLESCADSAEYSQIQSKASPLAGVLGGICGILMVVISPITGAIISFVGGSVTTYFLIYNITSVVYQKAPKQPSLIPSVRVAMKTREFQQLFANQVLIGVATGCFGSSAAFILAFQFNVIVKTSGVTLYLIGAAFGGAIIGMLSLIPCQSMINKGYEKLNLLLKSIFLASAVGFIAFFLAIGQSDLLFYLFFIIMMVAIAISFPIGMIQKIMLRDLVVYDTFLTGLNRESLYLTAMLTPSSIAISCITTIPSIALVFSGYKQHTDVDDDALDKQFDWNTTTVWTLILVGPLVLFVVGLIAYYTMKSYALNDNVANQINVAVASQNGVVEESEAAAKQLNENSQLLLHLSAAEMYFLFTADDAKSNGLAKIQELNLKGFGFGLFVSILLAVTVFVDVFVGSGYFATLLLTVFLITAFYTFYEYLRKDSLSKINLWSSDEIKANAKEAYNSYTEPNESLKALISRNGIQSDGGRSTLVDPIVDKDEEKEQRNLPGYKRIFFILLAFVGGSLAILIGVSL